MRIGGAASLHGQFRTGSTFSSVRLLVSVMDISICVALPQSGLTLLHFAGDIGTSSFCICHAELVLDMTSHGERV
jgi:hypothetical protein